MKAQELRDKGLVELREELVASQRELFSLRLQRTGITGDRARVPTHNLKRVRRQVARIKTILNEKRDS